MREASLNVTTVSFAKSIMVHFRLCVVLATSATSIMAGRPTKQAWWVFYALAKVLAVELAGSRLTRLLPTQQHERSQQR
jgi:hypothetical protein